MQQSIPRIPEPDSGNSNSDITLATGHHSLGFFETLSDALPLLLLRRVPPLQEVGPPLPRAVEPSGREFCVSLVVALGMTELVVLLPEGRGDLDVGRQLEQRQQSAHGRIQRHEDGRQVVVRAPGVEQDAHLLHRARPSHGARDLVDVPLELAQSLAGALADAAVLDRIAIRSSDHHQPPGEQLLSARRWRALIPLVHLRKPVLLLDQDVLLHPLRQGHLQGLGVVLVLDLDRQVREVADVGGGVDVVLVLRTAVVDRAESTRYAWPGVDPDDVRVCVQHRLRFSVDGWMGGEEACRAASDIPPESADVRVDLVAHFSW